MLLQSIINLKRGYLEEASLVEKMLVLALESLKDYHRDNFHEILDLEEQLNRLELQIEEDCTSMIALFQPEAKDLRVILMILKNNNDLERMGDHVVNMAESIHALTHDPFLSEFSLIMTMGDKTREMLHASIKGFVDEDTIISKQVCESDSEVDELNKQILQSLIQRMMMNPQVVEKALHITRIARNLERIADLSTNFAENTIYLANGRVIKHHAEE